MTARDKEVGFLARWSRRKVEVHSGARPAEPAPLPAAPQPSPAPAAEAADATEAPPAPAPPTLDDVAALTTQSDFTRFVRSDVDGPVRNAALKKLFADPAFNVMDGLDTYIEDYGRPDPLPESMLRKMAQAQFLGLFQNAVENASAPPSTDATAPALTATSPAPDEDPDLRLQPDDAAGRPGPEPGTGEDTERQP